MKKVLEQYNKHGERLVMRGVKAYEKSGSITPKQRKGIAYYRAASDALQRLINQGE